MHGQETGFLLNYTQAKKPGFCDDLCSATEISKETRFLEIYSGDLYTDQETRNRVSAMIFVAPPRYRKKPGFWRFILEIYARAKKPGFCDALCSATEISKETRFLEIYSGDLCTG
jgi:hypothetical protein